MTNFRSLAKISFLIIVGSKLAVISWITKFSSEEFSRQHHAVTTTQQGVAHRSPNNHVPTTSTNSHYGFIRITKTGSTSLYSFLSGTNSSLRPLLHSIGPQSSSSLFRQELESNQVKRNRFLCLFTKNHNDDNLALSDNNGTDHKFSNDHGGGQCGHSSPLALTKHWNESLPHLTTNQQQQQQPPLLQLFTMVRNPLNRLLSLYNYVYASCQTNQMWNEMFTKQQYKVLCDGDVEQWFKMLYNQGGGRTLAVPNQYRVFGRNLQRAMTQVQDQNILVLVNECYHDSLTLLEKQLSLPQGSADTFATSNQYHQNAATTTTTTTIDIQRLQKLAHEWFPDDFTFYRQAVDKFRRELNEAGIPSSCAAKLLDANKESKHPHAFVATLPAKKAAKKLLVPNKKKKNKFFAFIRIQKTGSTALLSFMYKSSGLTSWNNYIYSVTDWIKSQKSKTTDGIMPPSTKTPFCIFGHASEPLADKQHDHHRHDGVNPFDFKPKMIHNQCPHVSRYALEKSWKQSIPYTHLQQQQQQQPSLETFTIVREPFERLRSLYYYVGKFCNTTQAWKQMFTDDQYNEVCHGQFTQWVELLLLQSDNTTSNNLIFSQYKFLHQNLDTALKMIQRHVRGGGGVLVLVNECFEESLRFMEHKFELPTVGAADDFISSNSFRANTNKVMKKDPQDYTLRKRVLQSFQEEYRFYRASVQEFRRRVMDSGMRKSDMIHPCDIVWNTPEHNF